MSIRILGVAQDGGIPHLGCLCVNCQTLQHNVASIAILGKKILLVDATPNIIQQFAMLDHVDGIIITHLHVGHYIGLLQLGTEAAALHNFPVYVTVSVAKFLRENKPFSYLISRQQIQLIEIKPDVAFGDDIRILPFEVPHRNEDGNTIGLSIAGKLVYIPDIDYIDDATMKRIQTAKIVILDATFYSKTEISRQQHVPHPSILEIMRIFGTPANQFYLTHFNHSNPVLQVSSSAHQAVLSNGYKLAKEGMKFSL